jgi:hypothetical protein
LKKSGSPTVADRSDRTVTDGFRNRSCRDKQVEPAVVATGSSVRSRKQQDSLLIEWVGPYKKIAAPVTEASVFRTNIESWNLASPSRTVTEAPEELAEQPSNRQDWTIAAGTDVRRRAPPVSPDAQPSNEVEVREKLGEEMVDMAPPSPEAELAVNELSCALNAEFARKSEPPSPARQDRN